MLLGISWATHWELDEQVSNGIENMVGSTKIQKNWTPHSSSLSITKGKKWPSWVHIELSQWLHENSIPKIVYHQFWHGAIPLPKSLGTYSPLLLIRWGASFFFWQLANLIGPSLQQKKKELWRLPKIEGFISKYIVPPLWPSYIGKRRTTFGTAYGIKVRCYGEFVGEHIGNLWNILGPDRNPLGT